MNARIIAEPEEGAEIIRQMAKYDKIFLTPEEFCELEFEIDVSQMSIVEIGQLVSDLNEICDKDCVFASCEQTITFDFYVTSALVEDIRDVLNAYKYTGLKVAKWTKNGK